MLPDYLSKTHQADRKRAAMAPEAAALDSINIDHLEFLAHLEDARWTKEHSMDNLIQELARARKIESEYKHELEQLNAEIEALIQEKYKGAVEHTKQYLATAREDVAYAEANVRQAAMNAYEQTGDKHPHSAVQIKVYTTLGYDPSEAFHYCVEHLTTALKMDKRKFEKVARAAELDFVAFGDEPRATISRDLSEYL